VADERVVAIDGPAGSGKSTVAKALAARLGLPYLDTGAMYRAVAFAALRRGVDPDDGETVARIAEHIEVGVADGVDANIEIRGPEVTRAVSAVAANPDVRKELVRRQREWVADHGGSAVVEGRDIGTVVFPDAALKAYLTANLEVRAGRRQKEVADLDYETVVADMARRDTIDEGRDVDPLLCAPDAIRIDTTDRSVEDIVSELEGHL
jgi:CMP/dCMP kinase